MILDLSIILINLVRRGRDFFVDLIFPIECLGCGRAGEYLCPECGNALKPRDSQYCFGCKRPNQHGEFCPACRSGHALDYVLIVADYDDPLLRKILHAFKFNFVKSLASPLSGLLLELIRRHGRTGDLLVPVPLHRKRLRWRGFNQAELLARAVAAGMRMEMKCDGLVRLKFKVPQAELKEKERLKNVAGSFRWQAGSLAGRNVVLIDDVATTGATLDECARILKQAGAGEVGAVVVAKG